MPGVPWRVEFLKIFKIFFFKIPKMPKIVPESIQACFERVLGQIFRKIFLPSVPWSVEFSKIFKKKIFSKFQKCPKVFPKVSKRVLNMFWGKFFEKFYAQCCMEGRVFENFQKKNSQNSKMPKIVPKSIQTCFELVLGQIFRIIFLPSVPWRVEFSKIFKFFFSKFQKRPKSFPKESKRVLIVIWTIFSKNFCPVFHGRSSLRKFSKKNIFKIPKRPKSVLKSIQTCFEHVLGKNF